MAYCYCNKHKVSWDDKNHEDCLECQEEAELKASRKDSSPRMLLCLNGDECQEEHNPLPGYEDHHYGCDCDGCLRWYWTMKN